MNFKKIISAPKKIIITLTLLSGLSLMGCAASKHLPVPIPQEPPAISKKSLTNDEVIRIAHEHFSAGCKALESESWELAEFEFNESLDILCEEIEKRGHSFELETACIDLTERIELIHAGWRNLRDDLPEPKMTEAFKESGIEREKAGSINNGEDIDAFDHPLADACLDFPLEENRAVSNCLRYFTTIKRDQIQNSLNRSSLYIKMIRRKLKEKGLPLDLAYLVMIESGYNPRARSYARARGLWQFIPATGKLYDLKIDWWIDERCDPEKSTDAALNYLQYLHQKYDSWLLAIAAYNTGEKRVSQAIRKARSKNFWVLSRKRLLPRQTRSYVPAFIAAVIIGRNPEAYGFAPPELLPEPPRIEIQQTVSLQSLASTCNINEEILKDMNPHLIRNCSPPFKAGLRLPHGMEHMVVERLKEFTGKNQSDLLQHKVNRGETLSIIAAKYGTSVEAIAAANVIHNVNLIERGSVLLIPASSSLSMSAPIKPFNPDSEEERKKYLYSIRCGDTIGTIAQKFRLPMTDILQWNGLQRNQTIIAGETLVLWLPISSSGS